MSNQRVVLVRSISYLGADGVDHVGVQGEKVTVHADGVDMFDFVQGGTPEHQVVVDVRQAAESEKAAKASSAEAKKSA